MKRYAWPLVAVALMVAVLGDGLTSSFARTAEYPSVLGRAGYKDGPLPIPGTFSEIAKLSMPAGNFILSGKVTIANLHDEQSVFVSCDLQAGGDFDSSAITLSPLDGTLNKGTLSFDLAHVFAERGDVTLSCGATGDNNATAEFIKITGIKVGRFGNVPLD